MYDQSCRPATDGRINRSFHPATDLTSTFVASCDRSYEHAWHPVAERRSIVAPEDRWYDTSWGATIDRTINCSIMRLMVRSIVATYDRSYDQSWHQMIWNRRLEVSNMTIDLATTDFVLAITHDLCDQSYVLSTICPRFQHFPVAGWS